MRRPTRSSGEPGERSPEKKGHPSEVTVGAANESYGNGSKWSYTDNEMRAIGDNLELARLSALLELSPLELGRKVERFNAKAICAQYLREQFSVVDFSVSVSFVVTAMANKAEGLLAVPRPS